MLENVIVMLIVGGSAWYAGARYLPATWRGKKAKPKAGCGSGCDTCNSCATPAPALETAGRRVIAIHPASR
jgi:hypothetical protein